MYDTYVSKHYQDIEFSFPYLSLLVKLVCSFSSFSYIQKYVTKIVEYGWDMADIFTIYMQLNILGSHYLNNTQIIIAWLSQVLNWETSLWKQHKESVLPFLNYLQSTEWLSRQAFCIPAESKDKQTPLHLAQWWWVLSKGEIFKVCLEINLIYYWQEILINNKQSVSPQSKSSPPIPP